MTLLRLPLVLLWNLVRAVPALLLWVLGLRLLRRRPAVVRVRLAGALPELTPPRARGLLRWFAEGRGGRAGDGARIKSVEALREACERIARDARTRALVVQIAGLDAGWARARSVRAALATVAQAGKRVIVFLEEAGNVEYYVATAGTEILAPPQAHVGLAGVAATATFLADALQRAGVTAEFAAIGRYKNAPDMFTRSQMSETHRESVEAVVADLMEELVAAVAAGRRLEAAEAARRVAEGPYLAPRAVAAGLLDGVAYEDELGARAGLDNGADVPSWAAWSAARRPPVPWTPLFPRPAVVLLDWRGPILQGEGGGLAGARGAVASGPAVRQIRAAGKLRRARAVVVHVDSRGGSANASDLIARALGRVAAKKPVVAYLGEVAASGGYYIAAAASRIVAQPVALTGSIGVFAGKFSAAQGLGRLGVRQEVVAGAAHAAMGSPARPYTEEERTLLAREIGDVYEAFVGHVAERRRLGVDAVRAAAEGRVWTAKRAATNGLVDQLGGLEDAVREACKLAGLPEDAEVRRLRPPAPSRGVLGALAGGAEGAAGGAGLGALLDVAAETAALGAMGLGQRWAAVLLEPWRWLLR